MWLQWTAQLIICPFLFIFRSRPTPLELAYNLFWYISSVWDLELKSFLQKASVIDFTLYCCTTVLDHQFGQLNPFFIQKEHWIWFDFLGLQWQITFPVDVNTNDMQEISGNYTYWKHVGIWCFTRWANQLSQLWQLKIFKSLKFTFSISLRALVALFFNSNKAHRVIIIM